MVDELLESTSVFFHPIRVSSLTAFSCWNVAWESIPGSSPGEHLSDNLFGGVMMMHVTEEKMRADLPCGSWMLMLLLIFTGSCYRKNIAKESSNLYQRLLPQKWCKSIFLFWLGFSLRVKTESERERTWKQNPNNYKQRENNKSKSLELELRTPRDLLKRLPMGGRRRCLEGLKDNWKETIKY